MLSINLFIVILCVLMSQVVSDVPVEVLENYYNLAVANNTNSSAPSETPTTAPTVTAAPSLHPTAMPSPSPSFKATTAVIAGTLSFNSKIEFQLSQNKLNDDQITAVEGATCISMDLPVTDCEFKSQSFVDVTSGRRLLSLYDITAVVETKVEYTETQNPTTLYNSYKSDLEAAITTNGEFLNELNIILQQEGAQTLLQSEIVGVEVEAVDIEEVETGDDTDDTSLSVGAIIGIIVACVIVIGGTVYFIMNKQESTEKELTEPISNFSSASNYNSEFKNSDRKGKDNAIQTPKHSKKTDTSLPQNIL